MLPWMMQTPPALTVMSDADPKIAAMEKGEQWGPLADYIETLSPKQRGAHLSTWLKALQKTARWPRLLEICNAVLPQLEGAKGPQLSIARLERAQALSGLGRHGEAELAHEQNGKLGYAPGFANACVEARNAQDWSGLERCAGELLAAAPSDAQGLAWKGEAMAKQERYADAEPLLRQAVQADPSQEMAWNNLGRCLNAKQAFAEAVEALDHAVALDANEWEARYNRGLAEFRLGRYEASLKDLKAASALNPNDPGIRKDLAEAQAYVHPASKPARHNTSK